MFRSTHALQEAQQSMKQTEKEDTLSLQRKRLRHEHKVTLSFPLSLSLTTTIICIPWPVFIMNLEYIMPCHESKSLQEKL